MWRLSERRAPREKKVMETGPAGRASEWWRGGGAQDLALLRTRARRGTRKKKSGPNLAPHLLDVGHSLSKSANLGPTRPGVCRRAAGGVARRVAREQPEARVTLCRSGRLGLGRQMAPPALILESRS